MYFLSAVGFAAAVFFGVMLRRNEARTEQRLKQARADITDMTILFQTMRDIIGQQKALAKDFNEELEHKMGQVKHILNLSMEKNKQLYEKQQRIVAPWRFTFPGTPSHRVDFQAIVVSTPFDAPFDDKLGSSVTLEVTGSATWTYGT